MFDDASLKLQGFAGSWPGRLPSPCLFYCRETARKGLELRFGGPCISILLRSRVNDSLLKIANALHDSAVASPMRLQITRQFLVAGRDLGKLFCVLVGGITDDTLQIVNALIDGGMVIGTFLLLARQQVFDTAMVLVARLLFSSDFLGACRR